MKKILFIFLIFCTSFSYGTENNLTVIINSEKVSFSNPLISYNNYTLVSLKDISPYFKNENSSITYNNSTIYLKRFNSILKLTTDNNIAYIDNNQIKLPVEPKIYKGNIYIPIRIISDFYDCYIHFDASCQTIFIKDLTEFQQVENFFIKVQDKFKKINSVQIDIISELKNDTSSFSFGNSFYINKTTNSMFKKNILETNWEKTNQKISYNNDFNKNFFVGISFDRKKSSETQMVFTGYYPNSNNTLCKTSFYVDANTLYIIKQISEFMINDIYVKQNTIYSYM